MGWSADRLRQQGYNVDKWSENYLDMMEREQSKRGYSHTDSPKSKIKKALKKAAKGMR